jgi:hypothetical protein
MISLQEMKMIPYRIEQGGDTSFMDMKKLDSTKSVYELCTANPDVADILAEIGFKDIKKPGMLQTAGRFMTIPKSVKMKGFDPETVKQVFERHGYEIE